MREAGETTKHRELKQLALAWAQANGFTRCATEVRVPRSGYRADVAGCTASSDERTVVFECKQSRADLLKDAHPEMATRQRLAELTARRKSLEAMLAVHRPDLRRGEALWAEYDTWDFSRLEHKTHRAVLAELDLVQRRIHHGLKFSKMFRYRCADFLYLVVEEDIFAVAEIPAGWGLLVRRGNDLVGTRPPTDLAAADAQRAALREAIAFAGSRGAPNATFASGRWTSAELPKT